MIDIVSKKILSPGHRLPGNAQTDTHIYQLSKPVALQATGTFPSPIIHHQDKKLEWAASNGNRYPPYPQVMATAISQ